MASEAKEQKAAIERVIREIIALGSSYDVEALDALYDDDMRIVRVGADGSIRTTGKEETLRFLRTMRESGRPTLSQEAQVRVLEVGEERAHAIVMREQQAEGMPRRLVFSLDFVRAGEGWKVVREVAVAQS